MNATEKLLQGSIDMHIHHAPDPRMERRMDALQLALQAKKVGMKAIVLKSYDYPTAPVAYTVSQMVEKGAFIEHCFAITLPLQARLDPMKIVEAVRAVGAEHVVISTDLGQAWNPAPAEGMRMAIATMLRCGLSEQEIELMIKVNPAKLLDLD